MRYVTNASRSGTSRPPTIAIFFRARARAQPCTNHHLLHIAIMGKSSTCRKRKASTIAVLPTSQQAVKCAKLAEADGDPSLPAELWLKITRDLDLSDKVSLALVSQYHYNLFGHEALKQLRTPSQHEQRHKFLFHAFALFPNRTLCTGCNTYHNSRRTALERPYLNRYHDDWPLYFSEQFSMKWAQLYIIAEKLRKKVYSNGIPLLQLRRGRVMFDAQGVEVGDGWNVRVFCVMDNDNRLLLCIQYIRPLNADILQNLAILECHGCVCIALKRLNSSMSLRKSVEAYCTLGNAIHVQ
jgi:hypothetical protein